MNSFYSLLFVLCKDNSLAKGEPVCFYDCRISVLLFDICNGIFAIVKDLILCCGYIVFFHQLLGEHLAALDDSCIFFRSEGLESLSLQSIYHSKHQRIVGCNHHHIHAQFLCKSNNAVDIRCTYVKAFCIL